ncbi:DUF6204 family protein [Streptomyces telluris]|uniref:DUF6204 family protein n=1 Tax=Streptomyces telluris TaxID=2720021 RepID=A0A9X2RLP8_9ACTN|nr:DUF6204 family protein [Streptomyces telluris]MCQ8769829.1 DUF6204 family protein [Streptomyces telluris]NJP76430.1 hypothetical protein [Streptomyces telluris]
MSSTTYQVLTKGKFAQLSDEQRVALQAVASQHDVFSARFTEEGTVTYERALNGFTFRVLIPADEKDPEALVHGMAEELCTAAVRRLGADCRDLQSVSTDRASIKINRKGR